MFLVYQKISIFSKKLGFGKQKVRIANLYRVIPYALQMYTVTWQLVQRLIVYRIANSRNLF